MKCEGWFLWLVLVMLCSELFIKRTSGAEAIFSFDIQNSLFDIRHSPSFGISRHMLGEGFRPFQVVLMGFLPS